MSGPTPSQTAGPYYAMALGRPGENVMVGEDMAGSRLRLTGMVLDGDRRPIEDALVELWQADPEGRYLHPDDRSLADGDAGGTHAFTGFGRGSTDFETGVYWFDTVKPGRVPDAEGVLAAPHISVMVQGRGMNNPVFTRVYFSDEPEANAADLVLSKVPPGRRHTLIAVLEADTEPPQYRFDIRFQDDDETVFFDF